LELPPSLAPFAAAWCALVGAAVGSFLNVVVGRLPAGESIVSPGSRCPRCKTPIRWYDNVPVVSWVLLRARCRSCGCRISVRYPIVEALGAGFALIAFARHGLSLAGVAELTLTMMLLALALIDLDTWLLPHALTWPLLALGLLLAAPGITSAETFRSAALGAGIGFASFGLVSWGGEKLLKKEALGFGDVWLLAAIGAWLGVGALLPVVLLASLQGSVVGITLLLLGKGTPGPTIQDAAGGEAPGGEEGAEGAPPAPVASEDDWVPPKHAVPFGPFLVAGALEWLWLGGLLARWIPTLSVFR
jgi:leader peptidase (prepilin peptidase)/N-methyltransferase